MPFLAVAHGGMGLAFLASRMVEYFTLPFGLTDNLFASTFYALTGFHGLHVTLGTLMILIVWWQCRTPSGRIAPVITSLGRRALLALRGWHLGDSVHDSLSDLKQTVLTSRREPPEFLARVAI